jgi:hypothetical protein
MRNKTLHLCLFLVLGLLLAALPQTAGAVTGPGGVSTGLQAWYKADVGVETDTNGTSVTAWRDQSGNARDMVYPVPATIFKAPQPTLAAPGKVPNAVNGLPVISFNGNNSALGYAGAMGIGAPYGDTTVFLYCKIILVPRPLLYGFARDRQENPDRREADDER